MSGCHREADHSALGVAPQPRTLHSKVIQQLDDVVGIPSRRMCFAAAWPIALTMAAMIEEDALVRTRQWLNVTGVAPHGAVARPARLQNQRPAISDRFVMKLRAVTRRNRWQTLTAQSHGSKPSNP